MAEPKLHLLEADDIDRIHEKVLGILWDVGVQFNSLQALDMLSDAGCEVDANELSARIPAAVAEKALSTAPDKALLAARNPDHDVQYGVGGPYFVSAAQSVHFRDLQTRKRRPSNSKDLEQCAILCDALGEIDVFCPMVVPNDVPPVLRGLQAGRIAFANTSKHVLGGIGSLQTLPFTLEAMDALLGDRKELSGRPIISQVINDVSPLQKDGNLIDATLALREFALPIQLYYMPIAGSTSPVTLAGTLVEMTANMLGSIVLYQSARPGWPVIWGAGPGVLDMQSGRFSGGPEAVLISIAQVELARHYRLPVLSGWVGSYESKRIDFQSGMDAVMGLLPVALAGTDAVWGPGDLDGSNLVDLPYMLLGTEVVRQVKRLKEGIVIDEEHFLVQAIERMCFQGNYLGDPSTKRYFREEHMLPVLFPRESYESWEARGQSEDQMAVQKVKEILDSHSPEPLPGEVMAELDRIYAAAEAELS
jgi:trimethylamine--corrinoid protein Co-methyltransferase